MFLSTLSLSYCYTLSHDNLILINQTEYMYPHVELIHKKRMWYTENISSAHIYYTILDSNSNGKIISQNKYKQCMLHMGPNWNFSEHISVSDFHHFGPV